MYGPGVAKDVPRPATRPRSRVSSQPVRCHQGSIGTSSRPGARAGPVHARPGRALRRADARGATRSPGRIRSAWRFRSAGWVRPSGRISPRPGQAAQPGQFAPGTLAGEPMPGSHTAQPSSAHRLRMDHPVNTACPVSTERRPATEQAASLQLTGRNRDRSRPADSRPGRRDRDRPAPRVPRCPDATSARPTARPPSTTVRAGAPARTSLTPRHARLTRSTPMGNGSSPRPPSTRQAA